MEEPFREYLGEIPFNFLKATYETFMEETPWKFQGWTGYPKEPYRHWAHYPTLEDKTTKTLWECVEPAFSELKLKPHSIVLNLFNYGDSSWVHVDSEVPGHYTALVFLSPTWDVNWGGEFALFAADNEIIQSFYPTPGKIVLFKSNIRHGARPVSREAPVPRMGIAFQCS